MRPRIASIIVLSLLVVSTALPAFAESPAQEKGKARAEWTELWDGLVTWIARSLTIDFNAPAAGGETHGTGKTAATPPGDLPSYGLDADPNG